MLTCCKENESEWMRWLEDAYSNTIEDIPELQEVRNVVIDGPVVKADPMRSSYWRFLHSYEYTTKEAAESFFYAWWINKPLCNCQDADEVLAANPMSYESAVAFFESGVKLHNAVSAKPQLAATHPQVSVEEAKVIWKFPIDICGLID
jgi:hypothetical protein